jgi:anti-anti-sigma regulatory factor
VIVSHTSHLEVIRLPAQGGLRVIGEVDLCTREIWRTALEPVAGNRVPGRLDLSRLSFIDTRGATMLIDTAQRRPGPAPLTLAHPPKVLLKVLPLLCPAETAKIVIEEQDAA